MRDRISLPALKYGCAFFPTATTAPFRGLLATRGDRSLTEKLPNPRSSTRIAAGHGRDDLGQNGVHYLLCVTLVEMGVLAMDDFGKIGFQHQWQPYRESGQHD